MSESAIPLTFEAVRTSFEVLSLRQDTLPKRSSYPTRPPSMHSDKSLSQRLLDELVGELVSLVTVYHKRVISCLGKGDSVLMPFNEERLSMSHRMKDINGRGQIQNASENPISNAIEVGF